MKKTYLLPFVIITTLSIAWAFDWPSLSLSEDKISMYFGQSREGTINHSLIFKNIEEVFSTDKGRITCLLEDHDEDGEWFTSPLGNAAIIMYEDNLMGVYGNLTKETIDDKLRNITYLENHAPIGKTGNSAWTKDDGVLEFQIIDTEGKTCINPLILMPRMPHDKRLTLSDIILIDRHGKSFDLSVQKNIPAGYYSIYRKRQELPTPYTTTVVVNGLIQESIAYNTIFQDGSRITVKGNSNYSGDDIYGIPNHQMTGKMLLPHGKNTLVITATDLLGNETLLLYNLTAY